MEKLSEYEKLREAVLYRETLEKALDEFFPKGKCGERSSGLMLFAIAVIEHEKLVAQVQKHLSYLLAECKTSKSQTSDAYKSALDFYNTIRVKR